MNKLINFIFCHFFQPLHSHQAMQRPSLRFKGLEVCPFLWIQSWLWFQMLLDIRYTLGPFTQLWTFFDLSPLCRTLMLYALVSQNELSPPPLSDIIYECSSSELQSKYVFSHFPNCTAYKRVVCGIPVV